MVSTLGSQGKSSSAQFVVCQLYSYLCVPPKGSTWCLATCCSSTSSAALLLSWMTLADCFAGYVLWLLQNRRSRSCRIDVQVPAGYVQSFLQDMSHRNSATAPPSEYMISDGYRSGAAGGSAKGPPSLRPVAGLWHISQARFCPDL